MLVAAQQGAQGELSSWPFHRLPFGQGPSRHEGIVSSQLATQAQAALLFDRPVSRLYRMTPASVRLRLDQSRAREICYAPCAPNVRLEHQLELKNLKHGGTDKHAPTMHDLLPKRVSATPAPRGKTGYRTTIQPLYKGKRKSMD